MMMRIAEHIDLADREVGLREWYLSSKREVLDLLAHEQKRREGFRVTADPIPSSGSGLRRRRGGPAPVQEEPRSSDPLQKVGVAGAWQGQESG